MKDLFGVEVAEDVINAPVAVKKKRDETPKGYAAPPGTGPAGETCRTCLNLCRVTYAKTYFKCALLRPRWTSSYATEIRAKAPACRLWEKKP